MVSFPSRPHHLLPLLPPLLSPLPLLSAPGTLLAQDPAGPNEKRTHIAAQKPHVLRLHARHPEQVLGIRQMCI